MMICSSISELIGFECHPLSDDGSVAMIDTPFAFPDGDEIPVFVEKMAGQVRFFDDGAFIMHLLGRGVSLDDHRKTKFIRNLAEPNGVLLTDMGELEIWTPQENAPLAFAKYVATMLALSRWEVDQNGVSTDTSLFLDEVAMCLKAWKSDLPLGDGQEFTGVSGHVYKMDYQFDGAAVLAIGTHPATVGSTAKKLLDIRAETQNRHLKILLIIDDRRDADTAKSEGLILDSLSNVMMMTQLQRRAQVYHHPH
jgi:hypothetical protein